MKSWIQSLRYRRALRRIRAHMAALGAPVDHLTDEELATRLVRFGEAIRRAGGSAAEAQAGQQAAMRRVGPSLAGLVVQQAEAVRGISITLAEAEARLRSGYPRQEPRAHE